MTNEGRDLVLGALLKTNESGWKSTDQVEATDTGRTSHRDRDDHRRNRLKREDRQARVVMNGRQVGPWAQTGAAAWASALS